jgi:hypothetical protein
VTVAYVSFGPCFICRRDCDESSVNFDFGLFGIAPVCARCIEKADPPYESLEERLDMTEGDFDG